MAAGLAWSVLAATPAQSSASWLSGPTAVAPGVTLFTSTDPSLMTPPGPQSVLLLKLDPSAVTLSSAHAGDRILGLEPVDVIARRRGAVAAVNAGFFNTRNGDPAAVMKIAGELVSDATLTRGVVAIGPAQGRVPQTLTFDQLGATQSLRYARNGATVTVPIDGVDTTRARGALMLYTPMYHGDTDTALNGTEIVLAAGRTGGPGAMKVVREVRVNMGHTPIPTDGAVLSFGGLELPPAIAGLTPGTRVMIHTEWRSVHGVTAPVYERARDIVNGAGLLRRAGAPLREWAVERLSAEGFVDARHPRTLVGRDADGFVWLVAVDGRQADAGGMNFAELQALAERLRLTDALNLDGGGSTTMVIKGRIVNRPSDPTGPRPVSDVLLVTVRAGTRQAR